MQPNDELVLDALRRSYKTELTGETIRRALRDAARVQGIDIEHLAQEAAHVV